MRRIAEKYTNAHIARAVSCALHESGAAAGWTHGVAWALLAGGGLVHAATFTVTSAGDPGTGGMSLRQAVVQANGVPNSVVQFDPALVGSTITLASGEIAISAPMRIQGPGSSKLAISGNNISRVFNIVGNASTPVAVTVAGVALTDGHSASNGGALTAADAVLTISDAAIRNSHAIQCGGVAALRSAVAFTNVQFLNNGAADKFGAFCLAGYAHATGTISDSVVSGNHAFANGGGDIEQFAAFAIKRSRISGNLASSEVGGLSIRRVGAAKMTFYLGDSTISDNVAASGDAGGLELQGVYAVVVNAVISGNTANSGGGILLADAAGAAYPATSTLEIYTSTISGNSANYFGGGIDVRNVNQITIRESLISGNAVSAPSGGGGGIALRGTLGDALIFTSTIYGNYSYRRGGGIGILDAGAGSHTRLVFDTIAGNAAYDDSSGIFGSGMPVLDSCIVANNASHLTTQDLAGTFTTNFSLIKTPGSAAFNGDDNFFGFDPSLGPLAVNGGSTRSLLPSATSVVLNVGDPAFTSASVRDQRGLPRESGGRADIGAVERQSPEEIIFRNGFGS